VIAEFLALTEGSHLSMKSIIRNEKVFGGTLSNLNMIKAEVERYNTINEQS
jgi:ribosomal protein S2